MKCSKCGIDLVEGAKFCPECGAAVEAPVEEPVTETPAAEEPAVEEPVVEEPAVEEPAVEEPVVEEAPKSAFEAPKSAFASTTESTGSYEAPIDQEPYVSAPTYSSSIVEPAEAASQGLAIASLICGIASLVMCCCCPYISPVLGIAGIITGCMQKKDAFDKKPTMAIVGIILSSVGIGFAIISIIMVLISGSASFLEEMQRSMY